MLAGQGNITVPGTIGATPVDSPVDVEEGLPLDVPLIYYFGHVNPSENPDLYKCAAFHRNAILTIGECHHKFDSCESSEDQRPLEFAANTEYLATPFLRDPWTCPREHDLFCKNGLCNFEPLKHTLTASFTAIKLNALWSHDERPSCVLRHGGGIKPLAVVTGTRLVGWPTCCISGPRCTTRRALPSPHLLHMKLNH